MTMLDFHDPDRLIDDDLELVLVEKYPGDPVINRGERQKCRYRFDL